MDINQLLLAWAVLAVLALCMDVGAYLFLRAEWKKSGVLFTDQLWRQLFERWDQFVKTGRERLRSILLPPPHPTPSAAEAAEQALADEAVEIIPVTVKTIGKIRQVQFSMDMALNTTVNVRIGAIGEAGVKVEKRES